MSRPAPLPRLLAGFVVLLAFLLLGSGYAVAHSRLLTVTPADGAELDEPPAQVVLTFNEKVLAQFVTVRVTDGEGLPRTSGEPAVTGAVVTQALAADLGPGDYRVTYKVVSADSHPISGTTDFTVAGDPLAPPSAPATAGATPTPSATPSATTTESPSATGPPSVTGSPSPAAAATGAADPGNGGGGATPWLVGGGVLAAAGVGGVLYARSRSGSAGG
ncbi:MAG TPA: copper resistance protein CopC [Dermatophilaceae bacterium]|nr:copper resistance protein CopC [Dermatophilaceae bacterium]